MQTFPATDVDAYRALARAWAATVTVVTARRRDDQVTPARPALDGFTATAFLMVSITPPIVMVSITKDSGGWELFADSDEFVVNLLAEGQEATASAFSRTQEERGDVWSLTPHTLDARGVPLLEGALGAFSATVRERVDAGDHMLVLGDVVAIHRTDNVGALLYHNRAYGRVAPPQR